MFLNLPRDLLRYLCTFLDIKSYLNLGQTTKCFRNILNKQEYLQAFVLFEPKVLYLEDLIKNATLKTFCNLYSRLQSVLESCFKLSIELNRLDITKYIIENSEEVRNKLAMIDSEILSINNDKANYFSDYFLVTDDDCKVKQHSEQQKQIYDLLLPYTQYYQFSTFIRRSGNFYGLTKIYAATDNKPKFLLNNMIVACMHRNILKSYKESVKYLLYQTVIQKSNFNRSIFIDEFCQIITWADKPLLLLLLSHFPVAEKYDVVDSICANKDPDVMAMLYELDLSNLKLDGNLIVTYKASNLPSDVLEDYLKSACRNGNIPLIKYLLPKVNFTISLAKKCFTEAVIEFSVEVIDFWFVNFGFDVLDLCLEWYRMSHAGEDRLLYYNLFQNEPSWFDDEYVEIMNKWGGHEYFSHIFYKFRQVHQGL